MMNNVNMITTVLFTRSENGFITLTVLAFLSTLGCLLSALTSKRFYKIEAYKSNLSESLDVSDFKLSLVIGISVSVPLIIEFCLNMIFWSKSPSFGRSRLSRGILLFALIFTDFIMLFIAIPINSELILLSFHIRGVLGNYAIMIHLWEFGGPIFRCNLYNITAGVNMLSFIIMSFVYHPSCSKELLYQTFLCLNFIGMALFSVIGFEWLKVLMKKSLRDLTSDEYSCIVHLVGCGAVVCILLSVVIFYGQIVNNDSPTSFFVALSYITTAFTLLITIFDSRIMNREMYLQQETLGKKRLFVRYVSHEIRTPLNTVFVGLDVLRRELLSVHNLPEAVETVDELRDSCNIALEILNDLLNYEKLDAGLMKLEVKNVEVITFFQSILAPFQIQARHAGVDMVLGDLPEELNQMTIHIDESKMSQVVRNFISNALKFTPQNGTVNINISLIPVTKTVTDIIPNDLMNKNNSNEVKEYLQFTVKDTGAGISKENIKKIFKEIVQFNPGKLQNGGGSGLGLWISKRIVDLHGGGVAVFSEGEGCGCTFLLEIPVSSTSNSSVGIDQLDIEISRDVTHVRSSVWSRIASMFTRLSVNPRQSKILPSYRKPISTPPSNRQIERDEIDNCEPGIEEVVVCLQRVPKGDRSDLNSSMCVLVVDDAISNRKMMVRGLQSRGLSNILQAEDGQQAVDIMKSSFLDSSMRIDVVLMDYQMPHLDGPSASKILRELGFRGLIVGITGNALAEDTNYFLSQGANVVFTKPVSMDVLLQSMENSSSNVVS